LPRNVGGVDLFGEAFQFHAALAEIVDDLHQGERERPSLSSLHTTSVSPARSALSRLASSGRSFFGR
jgi:hypothetical protein